MRAPKAVTATAHKLTKLVYSMLRYGQAYVDAGAEYYESQYHHRALRVAKRRVAELGYQLVPHVQCSGPGCRRAPQPGGSLLKNLVSQELRLGRTHGMGWNGVGRLTLVSVNRRLASGQVNLVECGVGLPVIDGDDHRAGGVGYVPHLARAASLSG